MKTKLKLIAMLLLIAMLIQAQSVTQIFQGAKQNAWYADDQFVPTALTVALNVDTYVCYMDVKNVSSSATTILIENNAGTPIPFLPTATIAANSVWVPININPVSGQCRKFKSGISWQAGASNAVSVYMSGVQ